MKILKISITCMLAILYSMHVKAQGQFPVPINEPDYNKPKLFADLPDKIAFSIDSTTSLFTLNTGSSVTLPFSNKFQFQGTVVSHSDYSDALARTVIIKSINRPGAVLSLTLLLDKEGIALYKGRIVSMNNSDAFELVRENGRYFLEKRNLYDIISE